MVTRTTSHVIASVLASICSSAILHPIDLVKLAHQKSLQLAPPTTTTNKCLLSGTARDVAALLAHKGTLGAYRGLTLSSIATGVSWGTFRWSYDNVRRLKLVQRLTEVQRAAIASSISAAVTAVFTHPLFNAKTEMALSSPTSKDSIIAPFKRICEAEGIKGLYRGLDSVLYAIPNNVLLMVLYESFGGSSDSGGTPRSFMWTAARRTTASMASKLLSSGITYPLTVARINQQHPPPGAPDHMGTYATLSWLYKRDGPAAFYRGFAAHVQRTLLHTPLTFLLYEYTKNLFAPEDSGARH